MTENNPQQNRINRQQLLTVGELQESSPIHVRWAIQKFRDELVRHQVLYKYGRKVLLDEEAFWSWLKERGQQAATK